MSKHSKACCTLPAVVTSGYKAKGSYTTLDNGLKAYITGPSDATKALLLVFDIFGFSDQILQGADLLAHSDDEQKYQIVMPDFFDDKPMSMDAFPPKNEQQKKDLDNFFNTTANPQKTQEKIGTCLKAAEKLNPNIKAWGALGYCWGGKMVSLRSGADTPFKAAGQVHPAMLDPEEALKISIPMFVGASQDENVEDVKKYESNLKGVKDVSFYDTMPHGWMAARADLKDEKFRKEYERGYQSALNFFHANL